MSNYDSIAGWYSDNLHSGSPVHAVAMPALLELAGAVDGLAVCDVACGEGHASRALAARGARVAGVDLSEALLEIARAEETRRPLGIRYIHGDAECMPHVATGAFEGAVCSLALMDIHDLDRCLAEIARILRPGAWVVFTIVHPCFQTPDSRWTGKSGGVVKREVRAYFREGYWRSGSAGGVRGQVGAFHRTLSSYINAFSIAGLVLDQMREPQPQDDVAARVPGYAEAPVALAIRCRRSTVGSS